MSAVLWRLNVLKGSPDLIIGFRQANAEAMQAIGELGGPLEKRVWSSAVADVVGFSRRHPDGVLLLSYTGPHHVHNGYYIQNGMIHRQVMGDHIIPFDEDKLIPFATAVEANVE